VPRAAIIADRGNVPLNAVFSAIFAYVSIAEKHRKTSQFSFFGH
jgi:hypothetical protein